MNIKKTAVVIVMLSAFNTSAYERYSLFKDYIEPSNQISSNTDRVLLITKKVSTSVDSTDAAAYTYNSSGRVLTRNYVDSTFTYEYNSDGSLKSAQALMKQGQNNSYIQHTKENFISEYVYEERSQQLAQENKRVFNDFDTDFTGVPKATYEITYQYNEESQLIKRKKIPISGTDTVSVEFHYSYNNNDRLIKIREVNTLNEIETNELLLEYYSNGEIKKATQTLFGKGTKVIELGYVMDPNLIYSVYYSDPVKEWKVNMDFFGLAFHPIQTLKETIGDQITEFNYDYHNNHGDSLSDSLKLTITKPNGEVVNIDYDMTNQNH